MENSPLTKPLSQNKETQTDASNILDNNKILDGSEVTKETVNGDKVVDGSEITKETVNGDKVLDENKIVDGHEVTKGTTNGDKVVDEIKTVNSQKQKKKKMRNKNATAMTTAKGSVKLCLNMIVRNEEKVILRCFESVRHLISAIVIVDTGSDDRTIEIIQKYMKDNQLPGEVVSKPWVGGLQFEFDYNRNLALRALEKFLESHGGNNRWYALLMDADNTAHGNTSKLFNFNTQLLVADQYSVTMKGGCVYTYPWLLGMHSDPKKRWKWFSPRHEYVAPDGDWKPSIIKLDGGWVRSGREGCRSQNPYTYLEDTMVFLKQLSKDPKNDRACFYGAQSLKDCGLGDLGNQLAEVMYAHRIKMGGWHEEVYMSYLFIGKCQFHRWNYGKGKEDANEMIQTFLDAHNQSPGRREAPLYLLRIWDCQKKFKLAWSLAQSVLSRPIPTDGLFISSGDEMEFIFQSSLMAYYAGDKKNFIGLSKEVIKHPNTPENTKNQARDNLKQWG